MAFRPIPKQPTADKTELLNSFSKTAKWVLVEQHGILHQEADKRLQEFTSTDYSDLYQLFLEKYDDSTTFYVTKSLKLSYTSNQDKGLTDKDKQQFFRDLELFNRHY
ncbi:hypothetical protein JCM21714_3768 [Gracilibacillus boraciitolerans JCM 21714]|uniref:Uncharacterized protein n=1 Tax=Gracilibacillus boraciitolerans JCM 21714 TaxID=1298598 RepID=W4VMG9_9BACI|nr:hypothetical protein [Gracilibacillus boraciitolerans]GAE94595.1 hypothetical protein JCM21714_3768 [Gracilibacillus boraciitolerans JCM 21714]